MRPLMPSDLDHPEEGHPTFPEAILPVPSTGGEVVAPAPGDYIGALDLRSTPNPRMPDSVPSDQAEDNADRTHPDSGGSAVSPMPDRTIQFYDLPDQLARYDRMGGRTP